jgi:hypothetical protein
MISDMVACRDVVTPSLVDVRLLCRAVVILSECSHLREPVNVEGRGFIEGGEKSRK